MKKYCPGFTLIELLVVFSITALLFGFGINAYTVFNRRQMVAQAVTELKSNLRLVQNKASSGEKDCTGTLLGYEVRFSATGYDYSSQCDNINGTSVPVVLPTPITITQFPPNNKIFFKVLGQGTDIDMPATITFTGFGSYTADLIISRTGDIR